ncbi:DUF4810 domain-containing protein [Roseateles sp. DC23W]|uniref:DUF4810 domain-containing protein n=1 Tax=Pelomonas dachongensis TaxID=3299029 RepID=A0ABW7EHD3_9BURK
MKHLILIASLVLVGCAQPVKPIYQWEGYQPALYQHMKSDGAEPGAQILALEAQLQKNEATGAVTPPGMRAHLAMLYSKTGDDVAARRLLEAERAKFPESTTYVDFLLKAKSSQGAMPPEVAASQSKI